MKKTVKKLAVHKETLRNLEIHGMKEVRAGLTTIELPPQSHTNSGGEDCCISTHAY
jgi:hypothetical protein